MVALNKDHFRVPKGQKENREYRLALLARAEHDAGFQRAVIERCTQDCNFWVNSFVCQFNPNAIGEHSRAAGPFITWDFQDEAIDFILAGIDERHDVPIEKSREMGGTYVCLLPILNRYLFCSYQQFILISRNEQVVDKAGNQHSLFAKLDFMVDRLPSWMTRGRAVRRRLAYRNKLKHSGITGQASTGKAGVGDRATAMFIDEFSQIEADWEVWGRTADTTRCRIFNGTHLGLGTAFYKLTSTTNRKLVMHWSQHPDKRRGLYRWNVEKQCVDVLDQTYDFPADYPFITDGTPTGGPFPGLRSPWYDEECRRRPHARAVAMDLDINPLGSDSQFFDALQVNRLIERTWEPLWEGDISYDRETGEPFGLVPVPGGKLKLWINPLLLAGDRLGVPRDNYVAGADVATGQGATPSCLSVASVARREKVAEYADANILPEEFAVKSVAICRLFANPDGMGAHLSWELNGPGGVFSKKVVEHVGYRNIYYKTDDTQNPPKRSDKPGWQPGRESKRTLLEEYRADLYANQFANPSDWAVKETLAFKYDGRGFVVNSKAAAEEDPSGAGQNHSDRVIADALAAKMVRERGGRRTAEVEQADEPVTVRSMAGRERDQRDRDFEFMEVWG